MSRSRTSGSVVAFGIALLMTAKAASQTNGLQSSFSSRWQTNLLMAAALVTAICVYSLPVVFAQRRKVTRTDGIAAINILLGWSVIGWLLALAWACLAKTEETEEGRSSLAEEVQQEKRAESCQ